MKKKNIIKLLIPIIAGILYRIGGAEGYSKGYRRFILPIIVFGLTAYFLNSLIPLICIAIYATGTSLGYGKNSRLLKLLKDEWKVRFLVGIVIGLSTLPIAILINNYILFGIQFIVATLAMGILGTFNPFKEIKIGKISIDGATIEEFTIGLLSVIIVPFYLI
jgi:hypothetical protein